MWQRLKALSPVQVSLAVVVLCLVFHAVSFFVTRLPVVSLVLLACASRSFFQMRDVLSTGFLKDSPSLFSVTPLWLKLLHPLAVAYAVANLWFTYLLRDAGIDVALHLVTAVLLPWGLFTLMVGLAAKRWQLFVVASPGDTTLGD